MPLPPPFCMLALGKSGKGAYSWDHDIFVRRNHYRPAHNLCTFSGYLTGRPPEKRQRHNITQINLLAAATVLIDLWTLISTFYREWHLLCRLIS